MLQNYNTTAINPILFSDYYAVTTLQYNSHALVLYSTLLLFYFT